MNELITLCLVIALLVFQLVVLAVLIILCKKHKNLKKLFENHQASLDLERGRRPTATKEEDKNSYVEGRRDSSTLVRTNSKESIVYVPTPSPQRRSQNLREDLDVTCATVIMPDENHIGFENEHFLSSPTGESKRNTCSSTIAGSQLHKPTAGFEDQTAGSPIHSPSADREVDVQTAGSQFNTTAAVPSICVTQEGEINAATPYDEEELYENQEFDAISLQTLNNECNEQYLENDNTPYEAENMDYTDDYRCGIVNESHVTTAEEPVDEPIYGNREIINQYRT